MNRPYREAASGASMPRALPAELVCTSLDPDRRSRPGMAVLQLFLLPLIAGKLVSLFAPVGVSVPVMFAAAVLIVRGYLRGRHAQNCILQIEDETLLVRAAGSKRPRALVPLADLSDVVLDTKTIQRVVEGPSMVAAVRYIDTRTNPDVDVARIVLVERDGTTIRLGEKFLAHMDAVDSLGKIRVFLRKHGWLPDDERPADDEPDEAHSQLASSRR